VSFSAGFRAASTQSAAFHGEHHDSPARQVCNGGYSQGSDGSRWFERVAALRTTNRSRTCFDQQLDGTRESAQPAPLPLDVGRIHLEACALTAARGDGAITVKAAPVPCVQLRPSPPGDSLFKQRPTRVSAHGWTACVSLTFGHDLSTVPTDCPVSPFGLDRRKARRPQRQHRARTGETDVRCAGLNEQPRQ